MDEETRKEREGYEEYHVLSPVAGWIILILFSASLIAGGVVVHLIVSDPPREWDFGTLPIAPSESVYTTEAPPVEEPAPRQMEPLPEARPLEHSQESNP